jgi:hypothetical protein
MMITCGSATVGEVVGSQLGAQMLYLKMPGVLGIATGDVDINVPDGLVEKQVSPVSPEGI